LCTLIIISNTQTRLLDKISTFIDFIYCEPPGGLLIQSKNRKFKNKLAVPGLGKSLSYLLSNRKRNFQGNDSKKNQLGISAMVLPSGALFPRGKVKEGTTPVTTHSLGLISL